MSVEVVGARCRLCVESFSDSGWLKAISLLFSMPSKIALYRMRSARQDMAMMRKRATPSRIRAIFKVLRKPSPTESMNEVSRSAQKATVCRAGTGSVDGSSVAFAIDDCANLISWTHASWISEPYADFLSELIERYRNDCTESLFHLVQCRHRRVEV